MEIMNVDIGRLQLIRKVLDHVVANTKRRQHITPTLQPIRWS